MKKLIIAVAVASTIVGCGRISTGEIGVRQDFSKKIEMEEVPVGWYGALLTNVYTYEIRETQIEFSDLTPKAKDNLSLKDLDVSVFYTINPNQVAETVTKYSNMTATNRDGQNYPAFELVARMGRGAIYDAVAQYDSLVIHTKRGDLESGILSRIQKDLDASDPNVFKVTKVVVRSITTDPALEASIQQSVQVQKQVEAKKQELELAKAEAARLIVEAEGLAKRNKLLSDSITPNLIEYKRALALENCAEKPGCVMINGGASAFVDLRK